MTPHLWSGRRVLVTGHTGFKGAWLCIWLDVLGAKTYGYALDPPTEPSLYECAGVGGLVQSTVADVRDLPRLCAAVDEAEPELVFHMAAQSQVLRSYDDPVETYSTNVLGTVHVLEAIRRSGATCAIVNVTTDKVYANKRLQRGYHEGDELGGRDPYSSSKAASELVAKAYRMSFFSSANGPRPRVSIASARAGNVIGGGDWTSRQLVPDALAALSAGRPVALRRPDAVRPWQHVLDCLDGYLTLAEALDREPDSYSGEWNFGPPDSDCLSVAEIAEELAERMGVRSAWVQDAREQSPEEEILRLDASKAAELLGWRTTLPLSTTLDWAAEWHRGFQSGHDAADLCRAQIAAYMDLQARRGASEADAQSASPRDR